MTAAKAAFIKVPRPLPPAAMVDVNADDCFAVAEGLAEFVKETLLNEGSPLYNADHIHLVEATIGYLWTNVELTRQMKSIAGTAELPKPPLAGNAWAKGKYRFQMRQWFGEDDLDFLITIQAGFAASCSDIQFLALIDHELYHCAQKLDEFGAPKFNKEGRPVYAMRGHDVEEFVGVVRRYGVGSRTEELAELVAAAETGPEIAEADIREICGSC